MKSVDFHTELISSLLRIALVCALFGLASCSTRLGEQMGENVPSSSDTLAGSTWQVEDIDGGGIIDRSMVTIQFDDSGRIAGSTGCNRYFGMVEIEGERFSVSGSGSTRRACVPVLMQQEQRFLAALRDARTFRLEDDTWMVLADEAGKERLRAIQMPDDGTPVAAPSTIPEDRPSDTASVFTCTEGPIVTLRFLGPETIRLSVAGEDHVLQRQRSASGARYIGDGIEFWNKGQEAVLFMETKEYICTRQH